MPESMSFTLVAAYFLSLDLGSGFGRGLHAEGPCRGLGRAGARDDLVLLGFGFGHFRLELLRGVGTPASGRQDSTVQCFHSSA